MTEFSRRSRVAPFLAMDVMREAREKSRAGEVVSHMEVGQPGFPAPQLVRDRARQALDEDLIGYTEALGLPALRARIASHYSQAYGNEISADQVVVTTGSSAGFVLSFLACLDAGDKVLIAQPGYPCYREILKALDLEPVFLPLGFENNWQPSLVDIEAGIEAGARAVLLASPANPTGVVLDDELIDQIGALAAAKKVWFFMDEIYHGLLYDRTSKSAAGLNERTVVLNSFSKYYCMTGWRVGWMVVPEAMTRVMEKLSQHLYISAPALSQIAATAAFDARPELEAIKQVYKINREILLAGLQVAGIYRHAPADGAFYIYADVSDFTDDSLAFSQTLLHEYGIAACPGVDFDAVAGGRMMRFSYAGSTGGIEEAVARLTARPLPRK